MYVRHWKKEKKTEEREDRRRKSKWYIKKANVARFGVINLFSNP